MEQVMLDMIPTGAKAVCHVSQYDIGRTIRFNLRSGGSVYTLSGTETVKVYIKKPDGTTAERNIANTSSTYVDWVTGEGDCDQAGECECELVITSGTTVIGSKNFTVKIEEDPYNDQGVVTETAGPAVIATFTTNVVDLLQEVKCSINPIQNGTPWIDSNEVNKVPYIKRAVAGTATRIGNHLYDKLVGGTVAFNQLIEKDTNTTNGNLTISTNASTKKVSLNLSADGGSNSYASLNANTAITVRLNHKYIVLLNNYTEENAIFCIRTTGTWKNGSQTYDALRDVDHLRTATILNAGYDGGYVNLMIDARNPYMVPTSYPAIAEFYPQLIDLTAMFGSTIADYIYSLEQATVGAGVAWFKALFPNDYYAYNAGELMSVKATAHVMKNASNTVIGNYALDSNLELRGIPKLVNNKLEYDGDTYESSGAVSRRYGVVDLGSLTWVKDTRGYMRANCDNLKYVSDAYTPNVITVPYKTVRPIQVFNLEVDKAITTSSGYSQFWAYDSDYTDATAFKTAMNGVLAIFELLTPTTEQASPFTNPQVCDENGTEEYTDSRAVAIPVGHETYQANICEITGFDELNIHQAGANLFDKTNVDEGKLINGAGNYVSYPDNNVSDYVPVAEGIGYYLYGITMHPNTNQDNFELFNASKTKVGYANVKTNKYPFTIPSGVKYVRFTVHNNDLNTAQFGIAQNPSYVPFVTGKLIKLEFDDTVYLAEVSCLNGVWKLKLLGAEVDLGTLNYTMYSVAQGNLFRSDEFDIKRVTSTTEVPDIISSIFVAVASANRANHTISMVNNTARIDIIDDDYSDAVTFKSAVSGVKLVYPLATPTEITLDETEQFEALLGVNNVWHDGNGDTEVKYLYNA